VGDEIEADEEAGVGERAGGDLGLSRRVDAREAQACEDADDEQIEELAVPRGQ
jgi:hypothetical protein